MTATAPASSPSTMSATCPRPRTASESPPSRPRATEPPAEGADHRGSWTSPAQNSVNRCRPPRPLVVVEPAKGPGPRLLAHVTQIHQDTVGLRTAVRGQDGARLAGGRIIPLLAERQQRGRILERLDRGLALDRIRTINNDPSERVARGRFYPRLVTAAALRAANPASSSSAPTVEDDSLTTIAVRFSEDVREAEFWVATLDREGDAH